MFVHLGVHQDVDRGVASASGPVEDIVAKSVGMQVWAAGLACLLRGAVLCCWFNSGLVNLV